MKYILRSSLVLFVSLFFYLPLQAQEFFLNADLVNSYVWRGMKAADASIQPYMGVTMGGFTFYAWGTTDFHTDGSEIDLYLNYEYKGLKLELADYFTQEEDRLNYFNYRAHTSGHIFDASIGYTFSEKVPVSLTWYTIFAGNDYRENGKRAYSSYIELAYPFSAKGFDFQAEVGMTPWEGMYSDKLNVTNIGFSVAKEIKITDSFSLPISGKLIANPYEEQVYFVFGINL